MPDTKRYVVGTRITGLFSHTTTVRGMPFPNLIDVTTEDLVTGLESGQFTSVELTMVRSMQITKPRD